MPVKLVHYDKDGKVIAELTGLEQPDPTHFKFTVPPGTIEADVLRMLDEVKRGIIIVRDKDIHLDVGLIV